MYQMFVFMKNDLYGTEKGTYRMSIFFGKLVQLCLIQHNIYESVQTRQVDCLDRQY